MKKTTYTVVTPKGLDFPFICNSPSEAFILFKANCILEGLIDDIDYIENEYGNTWELHSFDVKLQQTAGRL